MTLPEESPLVSLLAFTLAGPPAGSSVTYLPDSPWRPPLPGNAPRPAPGMKSSEPLYHSMQSLHGPGNRWKCPFPAYLPLPLSSMLPKGEGLAFQP